MGHTLAMSFPPRPRVILDCDPGLDDAVAIALACAHSDVVGITTVGGNVALPHTTRNAVQILDLLGRTDVEVHSGLDLPLSGMLDHRATEYHGPTGMGAVVLPEPSRTATSDQAVDWMIERVRAEEGIWIVAVGPLTNVATAVLKAPDIVGRIAGLSWMGGSSGPGNTTAAAEFNAWVDPEAAEIVLQAGHRSDLRNLVMVGLNITHTVLLDDTWIAGLAAVGDRVASTYAELLTYYRSRQRAISTLAGAAVHDALAVVRVTHPELLRGIRRPVTMITSPGPARGMTLVDLRPRREFVGVNCEVVEWADVAAIQQTLFAVLRG
jgi:inosine-uridine nucleoside N-ribohydrolase